MRLQFGTSERSMISRHEDLQSRQHIPNKKISAFYSSFVTSLPVPVNRNTSSQCNCHHRVTALWLTAGSAFPPKVLTVRLSLQEGREGTFPGAGVSFCV